MKKKRRLWIFLIILLFIACSCGYFWFNNKDSQKLTSVDRDWIEKNKNDVIDIAFVNNVPVFNENGTGVLFDFAEQLKKDLGLELNPLPYNLGEETPTGLGMILTKEKDKDDVTIYEDHYVIVTNRQVQYNNLEDIPSTNIGVAKADMKDASYYLKGNSQISLKEYADYNQMISDLTKDNGKVSAIILPEMSYMRDIVTNETFNIAYHISDMHQYLTLHFGDNKSLNTILKKYINIWKNENYQTSFNANFTNTYFSYQNISENEKTEFTNKKNYVYGFVENAPYDAIQNKKMVGSNKFIMKEFSDLISAEITWKSYKNIASLLKDFNEGKVDFFFDTTSIQKYDLEITKTRHYYPLNLVVLAKNDSSIVVNSLASLQDKEVATVKDSKISSILTGYEIKYNTYNRLRQLIKSNNDILVMDAASFGVYKNNLLKHYKVVYSKSFNDGYHFVLNNKNKIFNDYFDFYLEFINPKAYVAKVDIKDFYVSKAVKAGPYIALVLLVLIIIIAIISGVKRVKKERKVTNISKEEKLRYIDVLTSLKNRNYLNKSMATWDENEIYPQAVIVIDLNNIAYINDNYGHEEGDKVIIQAANILIKNQVENTEIMRTSGNEFLIYLVGYEEKQIAMYIRKLNKDFKELEHGFGVAIGYSMIPDAIKSLDDAINEATIEMKNNKEESQNR